MFYLFFFKQKTAYEMRISDWSSDVCSSDLFPDNAEHSLPAVMGIYVLIDGKNGSPLALIDGPTLTVKRTAGASALASSYLSRPDSERLLMVGTGALAPQLIVAPAAVRPICNVTVRGRPPEKAPHRNKGAKGKRGSGRVI